MPTKDKRKLAVTERLRRFVAEMTKQFTTSVEELWQRVEKKLVRPERSDQAGENRQDNR